MLDENFILETKVLERLKSGSEWLVHDLAASLGLPVEEAVFLLNDLSRHYLLEVSDNRVRWSKADNPSALKPWGWNLVHEISIGSTMDYVRSCSYWSVVVAEYQLRGRGRHGKKWYSSFGGLWCSFRLPIASVDPSRLPLAIPLLVVEVLRKHYDVRASIKWPNDIIYEDRKLAGLLIEAEALHNMFVINVGVGMNVNNNPPIPGSTSLKNILGRKVPRNGLLSQLIGWLSRLDKAYGDLERLSEKYLENLSTLNRRVQVKVNGSIYAGVATGVNEYGDLIVKVNGEEKTFSPDEVLELRHLD